MNRLNFIALIFFLATTFLPAADASRARRFRNEVSSADPTSSKITTAKAAAASATAASASIASFLSEKAIELQTPNYNTNWIGPLTGTSGFKWNMITSDSTGANLAASYYHLDTFHLGGLMYSRDRGDTWTASGGFPSGRMYWFALASSPSGQFVAVGAFNTNFGDKGQLWTSVNYGQSFKLAASYNLANGMYKGLAFSSDGSKLIAAVFNRGVDMYNLDSGTGDVTQIGSTLTSVNGVSVVKAYKISADSTFTKFTFALTTEYGGIFYSTNGGVTWAQSNAPNSVRSWQGITSSANGQYLAAGTDGDGIFHSCDSGATWTLSTGAPSGVLIFGIASSYSGQIMIAGVAADGHTMYLSYDYGHSWQATNSVASNWQGVAISDNGDYMYGTSLVNGLYKSIVANVAAPSAPPNMCPSTDASNSTFELHPSSVPSSQPTQIPTQVPSRQPSRQPSSQPSLKPSSYPTQSRTTAAPSFIQSVSPTAKPSHRKTSRPTAAPTKKKTSKPTKRRTVSPTASPSKKKKPKSSQSQ